MATKKSAIIPYRSINGGLEILLITRSSGEGWGIPKGKIEAPLAPHTSATKEAFEEAGVLGYTHAISFGNYPDDAKSGPLPIPTFLLEVEIELAKKAWPERKKRVRLWVAADECDRYVTDKGLLSVIEKGVRCLRSDAEYFKSIMETLCEEHQWNLFRVDADEAEFGIDGGGEKRVRATRSGSTIRLSVPSSIVFKSEAEQPQSISKRMLERNAVSNPGCWCVEKLADASVYSCTHNLRLKHLDGSYFREIAQGLVQECDAVEALVKGQAPG